ncbi:hypothetical protein [Leucobacter luti]|uniref:hypothetical protein n=1 Tax=Leucobacter luti TaxID=340320 RepID=UPI001C68A04E|nr:hypothetical protein [Leucobacter luti]QYM75375.1 hypothetical protein K1X41_12140 [Leucobacter luti]
MIVGLGSNFRFPLPTAINVVTFFDLGGIIIGDRVMIGPGVTLLTQGIRSLPKSALTGSRSRQS